MKDKAGFEIFKNQYNFKLQTYFRLQFRWKSANFIFNNLFLNNSNPHQDLKGIHIR